MNFKNVFKKNQVLVYTMAFMLVVAGYFNYTNNLQKSNEIQTSTQEVVNENIENEVSEEENVPNNENIDESAKENKTAVVPNEEESKKTNSEKSANENKKTSLENQNNEKVAAIGDAMLVNSNEVVEDDYFAKAKIERESMYSQMKETYQAILNSPNSLDSQKEMASVEMAKINETKSCIMICENLLETKGFKECVIFVNEGSVSVIVGSKELKPEQTAQIQNIITRELGAIIDNIHISVK